MYCCSHQSKEWASDQVNSVRYLVDITDKGAHRWRRWAYYVVVTMTQICSWPLLYNQSRLDGWMRWLSNGCDSLAINCLNSWCRVLRDFLQCTDKNTYFPAFLAWGKLFFVPVRRNTMPTTIGYLWPVKKIICVTVPVANKILSKSIIQEYREIRLLFDVSV